MSELEKRSSRPESDTPTNGVPQVPDKFKTRQLVILAIFPTAQFLSGAVVSIQAPFYPAEAEKKGLSATEYGTVFGIFECVVFLVSFVYGSFMRILGPKFVFTFGLAGTGICSVLFGMLDLVEGHSTFFALSLLLRCLEATSSAGVLNALLTILATEFPNSIATVFASMESVYAVGFAAGPIIGGVLFQLRGFPLPFVSAGFVFLLASALSFLVLPTSPDLGESSRNGILKLIRIPEVAVAAFSIFASALSLGYFTATIEPHIRRFELTSISVGAVIMIYGVTYAIATPIWGRLCGRIALLEFYMLLGSVFIIIGYLIIGPAPFFPFDTILWLTCLGLVFIGIGVGGCLVASFIQALSSAKTHGFPDNASTSSLVGGIWASFFALGNFVGPIVSGILFDAVGFRNGTLFVISLHSLLVLGITGSICRKTRKETDSRNFNEREPLL